MGNKDNQYLIYVILDNGLFHICDFSIKGTNSSMFARDFAFVALKVLCPVNLPSVPGTYFHRSGTYISNANNLLQGCTYSIIDM